MTPSQAAQEKPTSPRERLQLFVTRMRAGLLPEEAIGLEDDLFTGDIEWLLEREAAGKDGPATPSLDVLRKEAWKFLDHITQQDYVGERVNIDVPALDHFRSVLARLDEGSATPPRIREVVGQGDGTMIVTLDDGTERRITEQEYLDWPRDEGSATPDQGKGEPR